MVKHTTKHPGFVTIARDISKRENVSLKTAKRELAASTRHASKHAKRKNTRLKRVP